MTKRELAYLENRYNVRSVTNRFGNGLITPSEYVSQLEHLAKQARTIMESSEYDEEARSAKLTELARASQELPGGYK